MGICLDIIKIEGGWRERQQSRAERTKEKPCAGYELYDRSKQEKSAVECQTHIPPVLPQQPIQNFKPLEQHKEDMKTGGMEEEGEEEEEMGALLGWEFFFGMIYLNDMVSEIGFLSLFPSSVLDVKGADEVSSPAPQQAIEELEEDA